PQGEGSKFRAGAQTSERSFWVIRFLLMGWLCSPHHSDEHWIKGGLHDTAPFDRTVLLLFEMSTAGRLASCASRTEGLTGQTVD
ncbi:MAG: hypothetical protein E6447_24380, partial [Bradyrhizobium sp.]|nr:hypothetical protein [Bradyrhizobium sp.]